MEVYDASKVTYGYDRNYKVALVVKHFNLNDSVFSPMPSALFSGVQVLDTISTTLQECHDGCLGNVACRAFRYQYSIGECMMHGAFNLSQLQPAVADYVTFHKVGEYRIRSYYSPFQGVSATFNTADMNEMVNDVLQVSYCDWMTAYPLSPSSSRYSTSRIGALRSVELHASMYVVEKVVNHYQRTRGFVRQVGATLNAVNGPSVDIRLLNHTLTSCAQDCTGVYTVADQVYSLSSLDISPTVDFTKQLFLRDWIGEVMKEEMEMQTKQEYAMYQMDLRTCLRACAADLQCAVVTYRLDLFQCLLANVSQMVTGKLPVPYNHYQRLNTTYKKTVLNYQSVDYAPNGTAYQVEAVQTLADCIQKCQCEIQCLMITYDGHACAVYNATDISFNKTMNVVLVKQNVSTANECPAESTSAIEVPLSKPTSSFSGYSILATLKHATKPATIVHSSLSGDSMPPAVFPTLHRTLTPSSSIAVLSKSPQTTLNLFKGNSPWFRPPSGPFG